LEFPVKRLLWLDVDLFRRASAFSVRLPDDQEISEKTAGSRRHSGSSRNLLGPALPNPGILAASGWAGQSR